MVGIEYFSQTIAVEPKSSVTGLIPLTFLMPVRSAYAKNKPFMKTIGVPINSMNINICVVCA